MCGAVGRVEGEHALHLDVVRVLRQRDGTYIGRGLSNG